MDPMKEKYRCTSCFLQGKQLMHTLAGFGVENQWQFNHVFLKQGCWTRCNTCSRQQGVALPQQQSTDSSRSKPQATDSRVCSVCVEKWLTLDIDVNAHVCHACQKVYPTDQWSSTIIRNHRHCKDRCLLCKECASKGYHAKDLKSYTCCGCSKVLGSLRFNKHALYNKVNKMRRHADLLC